MVYYIFLDFSEDILDFQQRAFIIEHTIRHTGWDTAFAFLLVRREILRLFHAGGIAHKPISDVTSSPAAYILDCFFFIFGISFDLRCFMLR